MRSGMTDIFDDTDDQVSDRYDLESDQTAAGIFFHCFRAVLPGTENSHGDCQVCFTLAVNGVKFQDDLFALRAPSDDIKQVSHPAVGCYEGNTAVVVESND